MICSAKYGIMFVRLEIDPSGTLAAKGSKIHHFRPELVGAPQRTAAA